MFQELKTAFGGMMSDYKAGVVATTKNMTEFNARALDKAILWSPARLIDQAESMLASWQRNDTDSTDTHPYKLPVILCAMANDFIPTGGDYSNPIADPIFTMFPNDPKGRIFRTRTLVCDIRMQVVVFAEEQHTAKSLAGQLNIFLSQTGRRSFKVNYPFAGLDNYYPAHFEDVSIPWMNIANNFNNVTILAGDLTLKATIPLVDAPQEGDPNDGKGVPGTADPAGFPFVKEVRDMNPTRHTAGKVTDDEPPGKVIATDA